jgi:putative ABC transport system ATP-binding protein
MLKLVDVQKSFANPDGGLLPVVDVERFEIAAAEQVLLMGQSGSGKTTLLHMIAGLTLPDQGEIWLDGRNITTLDEADRDRYRAAKLGYVYQTFNLLPGFTALENVLLGMTFVRNRVDTARCTQLLERVGLGKRLHHRPTMLSVGEQQRVAVARALANRPKLLLADEPTASVDARNQKQIIDLIRNTCREEQVALLLVTHSPQLAAQFDRVEHLEQFNRAMVT